MQRPSLRRLGRVRDLDQPHGLDETPSGMSVVTAVASHGHPRGARGHGGEGPSSHTVATSPPLEPRSGAMPDRLPLVRDTSPTPAASDAVPAALPPAASSARQLLPLVVPGIVVGVASALLLLLVTAIANGLEDILWSRLPQPSAWTERPLWIIGILPVPASRSGSSSCSCRATPAPIRRPWSSPRRRSRSRAARARARRDPRARRRRQPRPREPDPRDQRRPGRGDRAAALPRVPGRAWAGLAFAGTIGAMFGTPIGAALLLSEPLDESGQRPVGPPVRAAGRRGGRGAHDGPAVGESFVLTSSRTCSPS